MSSAAVRAAVRALVTDPGWPVLFVETTGVNVAPETLPDDWTAVEFEGYTDNEIGIGGTGPIRETGRVAFWIGAKSGLGDAVVAANADLVVAAIRAHPWGASGIYPVSISAPLSDDDAPAGNFITMRIELEYERDHA